MAIIAYMAYRHQPIKLNILIKFLPNFYKSQASKFYLNWILVTWAISWPLGLFPVQPQKFLQAICQSSFDPTSRSPTPPTPIIMRIIESYNYDCCHCCCRNDSIPLDSRLGDAKWILLAISQSTLCLTRSQFSIGHNWCYTWQYLLVLWSSTSTMALVFALRSGASKSLLGPSPDHASPKFTSIQHSLINGQRFLIQTSS